MDPFFCRVVLVSLVSSLLFATSEIEDFDRKTFEKLRPQLRVMDYEFFRDFVTVVRANDSQRYLDLPAICNGRLTLTSGSPIITSGVTAATTVYFTPYKGAKISLYDGARWKLYAFSEKSVAVPSTTNTPFDIFAYDGGGAVTLETANWTNDTTRATALTLQDGV